MPMQGLWGVGQSLVTRFLYQATVGKPTEVPLKFVKGLGLGLLALIGLGIKAT